MNKYTLTDVIENERYTVRIYRPNIDDITKERRINQIANAAVALLKEKERSMGRCTERMTPSPTSTVTTSSRRESSADTRYAANAAR